MGWYAWNRWCYLVKCFTLSQMVSWFDYDFPKAFVALTNFNEGSKDPGRRERRRSEEPWVRKSGITTGLGPNFVINDIFRTREKEELIRRLSTNHATADIFKNTTNMRKFSTQSMRGDPTLSMTMDSQGRNTLSNTPSSHSNKERKNSVLTLLNTDGVQDPVRLRKFSI